MIYFPISISVPHVPSCNIHHILQVANLNPQTQEQTSAKADILQILEFCYIVVSIDPRYNRKPLLYHGPNAVEAPLNQLEKGFQKNQ